MQILAIEVSDMRYVEMTIEEAIKYSKGNKSQVVLVAVTDLENDEQVSSFSKIPTSECENIIKKAETIAKACDDFVNSLKCFTVKQDLKNIQPVGKVSTVLLKL